jgi:putative Mg2+ transporter-C (MgtC) family protein
VNADSFEMLARLLAALAAGALIGYERSFHGRPAGFRTHALVCTASSLLMLVTVYEAHWMRQATGLVQIDPTRMAQGIMTGIGFLGAGVIFKEGLTVRGLTTAASIWITAALGILYGVGFYLPAVLGTLATLGTLSLFRWIEAKMPTQAYAQLVLRFKRERTPTEVEVRGLIAKHGFSVSSMSYRLDETSRFFEYRTTVFTVNPLDIQRLAAHLRSRKDVIEFRLSPTGD